MNDQTHNRRTTTQRQHASVTCLTPLGLGMGCVCSPTLACWKINAVEQCSSALNNVWAGYSRRDDKREKRKEESTFFFFFILHSVSSCWKVSGHALTRSLTHTWTYRAKSIVRRDNGVLPMCWWHVSHRIAHFPLVLAAPRYSVSQPNHVEWIY